MGRLPITLSRTHHLDSLHKDGLAGLADFLNHPILPSDIRDFPFLNKSMPECVDECNPFAECLDELLHDSVVPEPFLVQSVGMNTNSVGLCEARMAQCVMTAPTSAWVRAEQNYAESTKSSPLPSA